MDRASRQQLTAQQVTVTGKVQGVFYRSYTKRQAVHLSLSGWVRNCADGSVEAFVQGPKPAVALMLDWFWQGSPLAVVKNVTAQSRPVDQELDSFTIRR